MTYPAPPVLFFYLALLFKSFYSIEDIRGKNMFFIRKMEKRVNRMQCRENNPFFMNKGDNHSFRNLLQYFCLAVTFLCSDDCGLFIFC